MVEVPSMKEFVELSKQVQTQILKFEEHQKEFVKLKSELLILAEIVNDATVNLLKELEEIT